MTASNERGPILVLLDGSELAEQAVPMAAALAGRADAELVLVHVHARVFVHPIYVGGPSTSTNTCDRCGGDRPEVIATEVECGPFVRSDTDETPRR